MPTLTIRIDEKLDNLLTQLAREQNRSKSDLVRQMLRQQSSLALLDTVRKRCVPLAEKAGYFTDEDIFRDFS